MPCKPDPRGPSTSNPGPSSATTTSACRRRGSSGWSPSHGSRTSPRSGVPRGSRSRSPLRHPARTCRSISVEDHPDRRLAGLGLERRHQASVGEDRWIVREPDREASRAHPSCRFGGRPSGSVPGRGRGRSDLPPNRCFTARATSCCWAPSWRLRSSLPPLLIVSRNEPRRDARSSSIRRTLDSTRPAWAARSSTSFSSIGDGCSPGLFETDTAPRRSPS